MGSIGQRVRTFFERIFGQPPKTPSPLILIERETGQFIELGGRRTPFFLGGVECDATFEDSLLRWIPYDVHLWWNETDEEWWTNATGPHRPLHHGDTLQRDDSSVLDIELPPPGVLPSNPAEALRLLTAAIEMERFGASRETVTRWLVELTGPEYAGGRADLRCSATDAAQGTGPLSQRLFATLVLGELALADTEAAMTLEGMLESPLVRVAAIKALRRTGEAADPVLQRLVGDASQARAYLQSEDTSDLGLFIAAFEVFRRGYARSPGDEANST